VHLIKGAIAFLASCMFLRVTTGITIKVQGCKLLIDRKQRKLKMWQLSLIFDVRSADRTISSSNILP
jgi:hypothetical protein